jgi:nucleoside-diphosphate kinase
MQLAQDELQKRGLAGAVAADQADPAAGGQARAGTREDFAAGDPVYDIFNRQHSKLLARLLARLAAPPSRFYKAPPFQTWRFPMAFEQTLSIIKPDATRRNLTGQIVARFEKAGLRVVAQKRIRLSTEVAEAFYNVHKARPFFRGLVEFMTSGPVVVQVLEGEGAIAKNREVMGATDPAKAAEGTIRKDFAESIEANSVHGSDAPETAREEIRFFFSELEIVG